MDTKTKKRIAICGFWAGLNYGSELTNYAMYLTLKNISEEFSPIMIDVILSKSGKKERPPLFLNNPYPSDILYGRYATKKELSKVNDLCDIFIHNSDQQLNDWVYTVTGKTAGLDFITSNKKKIAYAASYGHEKWNGSENIRAELSYLLKKFKHFSVREKSAVSLSKNTFGVDSHFVLDPVFLQDISTYTNLASTSSRKLPENPYLFSYILDLNSENIDFINWYKFTKNIETITVTDAEKPFIKKHQNTNIKIEDDVYLEEWLNYIHKSNFYITDSFHGLCLGIILKKQFVCLINGRGQTRIESILGLLGLQNRIATNIEEAKHIILNEQPIDYDKVNSILNIEKEKSIKWLTNAINDSLESENDSYSSFDILNKRITELEEQIISYKKNITDLEVKISFLTISSEIKRKYYRYKVLSKILIGKKRKHYKQKAEIYHEKVRKIRKLQNEALNV